MAYPLWSLREWCRSRRRPCGASGAHGVELSARDLRCEAGPPFGMWLCAHARTGLRAMLGVGACSKSFDGRVGAVAGGVTNACWITRAVSTKLWAGRPIGLLLARLVAQPAVDHLALGSPLVAGAVVGRLVTLPAQLRRQPHHDTPVRGHAVVLVAASDVAGGVRSPAREDRRPSASAGSPPSSRVGDPSPLSRGSIGQGDRPALRTIVGADRGRDPLPAGAREVRSRASRTVRRWLS